MSGVKEDDGPTFEVGDVDAFPPVFSLSDIEDDTEDDMENFGEVWSYSSLEEGELSEHEPDEVWSDGAEAECLSSTPAHRGDPLLCQITASPIAPSPPFFQDLFGSGDEIGGEFDLLKYYGLDGVDEVIREVVEELVGQVIEELVEEVVEEVVELVEGGTVPEAAAAGVSIEWRPERQNGEVVPADGSAGWSDEEVGEQREGGA